MNKPFLFTVCMSLCFFAMTSCDTDKETYSQDVSTNSKEYIFTADSAKNRFAEILSKAIYNNKEVRCFLKKEACTEFDKNYDILYAKVKDTNIGKETFEKALTRYSSIEELRAIYTAVPTLNIYIPDISMFNVNAANLDCEDKETPVVLPNKKNNNVYMNGQIIDTISKGCVPDFHVFIVNTNSRVTVNTNETRAGKAYTFIDDAFDGEKTKNLTRGTSVGKYIVGNKAVKAYTYFNRDDGSNYSKALQRDYIYYGMTPDSTKGTLNKSVTEYLVFIELDPKTYFNISDNAPKEDNNNKRVDDPELKKTSTSRKKRDFTYDELINEFWTSGTFNIRVEMILPTSAIPIIKYIPVSPNDIWNFNYSKSFRHRTAFRHSKYTYRIDPARFTAKTYYLPYNSFSFEKWNLANEGLTRIIHFYETDPGENITQKYSYEITRMTSEKINGNIKIGLGIGKVKGDFDLSGEASSANTIKETKEVSITYSNKDDDLGMDIIDFYDPIIESKSRYGYSLKTYNTGYIKFGITAR